MSKQDLMKDIIRLKLRIEEELIGKLYEVIQGRAGERRRDILQAVREIYSEFLAEEGVNEGQKGDLKTISVE